MVIQKIKNSFDSSLIFQSLFIFFCFTFVALIGMILNPLSFQKFFFLPNQIPIGNDSFSYYWDVAAYAEMALALKCSAFYPLWPSIVSFFYNPNNIHEAAYLLAWASRLFFLISLPLLIFTFRQALHNKQVAFACSLLYSISPFSIFRVIGYTESIFVFFSLILIILFLKSSNQKKLSLPIIVDIILIGLLGGLMSLTRPSLLQIFGSCLATLLTLCLVEFLTDLKSDHFNNSINYYLLYLVQFIKNNHIKIFISTSLVIGAIVGYSVYGYYCWQTTGNFLQPFALQKLWDKSLAFRPWLLFTSRSPLEDLQGFYFPILLWAIAILNLISISGLCRQISMSWNKLSAILMIYPPLWIVYQGFISHRIHPSKKSTDKPSLIKENETNEAPLWMKSYVFWFSIYFACSHSAIVFLTQDRMVSLARYIFGQPFIFLALGYLLIDHKRFIFSKKLFYFFILLTLSSFLLLRQWLRYGYHEWMG